MVANNIMKNDDISINYIFQYNIEKEQEKNNQVVKINILDDGRLDRAFGTCKR